MLYTPIQKSVIRNFSTSLIQFSSYSSIQYSICQQELQRELLEAVAENWKMQNNQQLYKRKEEQQQIQIFLNIN